MDPRSRQWQPDLGMITAFPPLVPPLVHSSSMPVVSRSPSTTPSTLSMTRERSSADDNPSALSQAGGARASPRARRDEEGGADQVTDDVEDEADGEGDDDGDEEEEGMARVQSVTVPELPVETLFCTICQDNIQSSTQIISLICTHKFHDVCVREFATHSFRQDRPPVCPLCRVSWTVALTAMGLAVGGSGEGSDSEGPPALEEDLHGPPPLIRVHSNGHIGRLDTSSDESEADPAWVTGVRSRGIRRDRVGVRGPALFNGGETGTGGRSGTLSSNRLRGYRVKR